MAKIACNWSKELLGLITGNQVKLDYIKSGAFGAFHDDFETMRSLRPVLLHGLGHHETAGMKNTKVVDFKRANRLLAACGSPHYGLHLAITNGDMAPDLSKENIPERMFFVIQAFKKKLSVPLLLENIPESPQEIVLYDYYPYSSPEQISKIIHDNDVDFLLDLTHAKIACITRGWDVRDYLRALPLKRIREIHVNGVGRDQNGFPDDTHEVMKDDDYELLDFVLRYANPGIISLEYIGTPSETKAQITENLYTQLNRLGGL